MTASELVNGSVFLVDLYGFELGFSKVSGLGDSVEYDSYLEGGGRMHLLYRPAASAGTITLEKGIPPLTRGSCSFCGPARTFLA